MNLNFLSEEYVLAKYKVHNILHWMEFFALNFGATHARTHSPLSHCEVVEKKVASGANWVWVLIGASVN